MLADGLTPTSKVSFWFYFFGGFSFSPLSHLIGVRSQHFTMFQPHVPIVLDHTKESSKFFDVVGQIEHEDCLHHFWLWLNSTSVEDVS